MPWSPFGGADRASEVGSRYGAFAEVAEGLLLLDAELERAGRG